MLCAVITVGLDETMYNVNETDGSVMVCASTSDELDMSARVIIMTVPGTAQGTDTATHTDSQPYFAIYISSSVRFWCSE